MTRTEGRTSKRALVVVAHPDDESFGCGSVIAGAVRAGYDVVVCCATRGEAGEFLPGSVPDGGDLAAVREAELRQAAALLGVSDVVMLGFEDSGWDGDASPRSLCGTALEDVVQAVESALTRVEPDLVVTLDPSGGDGHRDHVRIGQATTLAFDRCAAARARLYYWCIVRSVMTRWVEHNTGSVYEAVPGDQLGCPDEQITTTVDVTDLLPRRLEAMARHRSQQSPYDGIPDDLRDAFLTTDRLVRARPPWTGGLLETTLF